MNSEIKEKWVTALRSGEYKQGQKRLRVSDDTFCCLGVLCDLYIKEHPDKAKWIKDETRNYYTFFEANSDGAVSALTFEVISWAGLQYDDRLVEVSVGINGKKSTLAEQNDIGGIPFSKIADLIEEQL